MERTRCFAASAEVSMCFAWLSRARVMSLVYLPSTCSQVVLFFSIIYLCCNSKSNSNNFLIFNRLSRKLISTSDSLFPTRQNVTMENGDNFVLPSPEAVNDDEDKDFGRGTEGVEPEVMGTEKTPPIPPNAPMSREDRKIAKKTSKYMAKIASAVGIKAGDQPSEGLAVWGIGVANGVPKVDIYAFFNPKPVQVNMFVDQTFVTLLCASREDAIKIREKYHGKKFHGLTTLYIQYLKDQSPSENSFYVDVFNVGPPSGADLHEEFINGAEEATLYEKFSVNDLTQSSQLRKRKVQHFGYEFRYGTNDVNPRTPLPNKIPDFLNPIIERMVRLGIFPEPPDQLTVNHYEPGQGIPRHCDTHSCFEGPIVSLSLGSEIVMTFRKNLSFRSVILPPRSLLVLNDSARYEWTHEIVAKKVDIVPDPVYGGMTVHTRKNRISLTFRRLKRGEFVCRCPYPDLCDSQKGRITNENAPNLETDLVHNVYEEIADHFTETRQKPWPLIEEFVKKLNPGSLLLDVGCANGKYFGLNPSIFEVGIDMSEGLLNRCWENKHEAVRGNALALPFRDNYFTATISIAVLHHVATKERRLRFLEEMVRVIKPGGKALIYVWAKEQNLDRSRSTWSERQDERSQYIPIESSKTSSGPYLFIPLQSRDPEFQHNDVLVPWVMSGEGNKEVYHRYYHVFSEGELESLVKEMNPPPEIIDQYYDQGNWVVALQKPSPKC